MIKNTSSRSKSSNACPYFFRDLNANIISRLPGNAEIGLRRPEESPSATTILERKALEIFSKAQSIYAPRLLGFKQDVQNDSGPLPGGYITYTLMSKVSGISLFDLHFWTLSEKEREDIERMFLKALVYD